MPTRYPSPESNNLSGIHLLGFRFGNDTASPFNLRFGPWSLLPYMDVFSEDVKKVLFEKNIFFKLVPIFAKHTKVTDVLNKIIGMSVFKPDDKKGLIEELADALIEEDESRKTLFTRIEKTERALQKAAHAFQGLAISYQDGPERPKLNESSLTSGTIIGVEGVLNRVSAVAHDQITADRLKKAGAEWLISDDPFFAMGQHNPLYQGNPIAVRFPPGLLEAASANPPFSSQFAWYPYITVVGVFQENWSAKAPGIRTLEAHWMRIRRPRDPNDQLEEELGAAFSDASWRRNHRLPFYDKKDEHDCLYALYLMMFTYACADASVASFSPFCKQLSEDLRARLSSVPPDLGSYFGW